MLEINGVIFQVELIDILKELRNQLNANGNNLLASIQDTGGDLMVTCPYHKDGMERRPSAGFRKYDGVFHCFTCGEIHTLPEVISYCFGKDDKVGSFGWTWLLKNFASVSIEDRKDISLDLSREIIKKTNNTPYVLEDELDKYRWAHPYWEKRGITDADIIELFDLGFDKEQQCVTMPCKDENGNCLFIARRSVEYKYFNYPKDVEKPLYGLYEIKCSELHCPSTIYICESMIDCLRLWQLGYYAIALNGLGSKSQISRLNKLDCREYVLCLDNDKAGKTAMKNLQFSLPTYLISYLPFDVLSEYRKDIGECSDEEIKKLVEHKKIFDLTQTI